MKWVAPALLGLSALWATGARAELQLGLGVTTGVATLDSGTEHAYPVWGFSAGAGVPIGDFALAVETTIFMSGYRPSSFTVNGARYDGDLSQRRTGFALTGRYSPAGIEFAGIRPFVTVGAGVSSIDAVDEGEDIRGGRVAHDQKLFLRGWSALAGIGASFGDRWFARLIYERDRYTREELVARNNDVHDVSYSGHAAAPRDQHVVLLLVGLRNVLDL